MTHSSYLRIKIVIPKPTFEQESRLWKDGIKYVVGVDEVGRGAFAGPLVACGVIFTPFCPTDPGIQDSKLLSAKKREELAKVIRQQALLYVFCEISVSKINRLGIGKANNLALQAVVECLLKRVGSARSFVLVDGQTKLRLNTPQKAMIKGDRQSITIAAASILAKVHRDSLMSKLDLKYENYGFAQNKGYGTSEHRNAIGIHGLSDIHRKCFALKKFLM